jgi:hypothetical protein
MFPDRTHNQMPHDVIQWAEQFRAEAEAPFDPEAFFRGPIFQ